MKKIYEVEFKHLKLTGMSNVTFCIRAKNVFEAVKTGEKFAKNEESEDKLVCIRCEYLTELDN